LVSTTIKTTKSEEIFAAAQNLMPGGLVLQSVPSNPWGQPIVFERVKGAYIWDVDGNQYIDYVGSWGPAICGHAHPDVIGALKEAAEKALALVRPQCWKMYWQKW
jgi:glutamate-1-semialdehyde 2,1-aminomutase